MLDKLCIALELELIGASIVDHSGMLISSLLHIRLVFLHLQEVADRGDLLTDEMIHRVGRVVTGVLLNLLDDTAKAPARIPCL